MGTFLKAHPFAVEAYFDRSLVLTYAFPKAALQSLIPECLQLDTHNDQWAFLAIAMVQTRKLRPKGFPAFLGNDFFLIGYRVFVRYIDNRGKRLRGLYILKSETDSARMAFLGNILTRYAYTTTDISQHASEGSYSLISKKSGIRVEVDWSHPDPSLPEASPFQDWKEARRFAGPLPYTFSYDGQTRKVWIVEGQRQFWEPRPVRVLQHKAAFLNKPPFYPAQLASAFIVEGIPYHWKKARVELWKPESHSRD